jgi:hypothetical protein
MQSLSDAAVTRAATSLLQWNLPDAAVSLSQRRVAQKLVQT